MSRAKKEEVRTSGDLEQDPLGILKRVVRTGRSVVLTVEGKPAAVLMDIEAYEKQVHTISLARLLAEGQADVRAGRTRPASEVFDLLSRGKKVSR